MSRHTFKLFADYFQFYLQDESVSGDLSKSWTREAVGRLLALAPGTIGVGTVRNMFVPVTVEIVGRAPVIDLSQWDHIVERDLDVPSGRLVIAGCTDYFPHAARVAVEPGLYRVRIGYGHLDDLSEDGLDGTDHYDVFLWKSEPIGLEVLKHHPPLLKRS